MSVSFRSVSSVTSANEFKLTENVICLPNPPIDSDRLCHLTSRAAKWLHEVFWYEFNDKFDSDAFGLHFNSSSLAAMKKQMKQSPCIGNGGPFVPIKRSAGYEYYICTFRIRVQSAKNRHHRVVILPPADDEASMQECDVMPWLMRLATAGAGVALDIGAGNSGDCSWPLLSEGHTVHMFETGYENKQGKPKTSEREFVQLTRDINGWHDVAKLHGAVTSKQMRHMEKLFNTFSRIELLKIDVEDKKEYATIFKGIEAILNKTEIVQIEMHTSEIGMAGKHWILDHFFSRHFDLFGLEDVETFPGFQHASLGAPCRKGDMDAKDGAYERWTRGDSDEALDYEYGQDGPGKIRMFPICKCNPSSKKLVGRGFGSSDPLRCNSQFAFIRRGSQTIGTVTGLYGSCQSACGDLSQQEL
eukprot:gnl/MRDRNA2_/MRDRNA2_16118_c0_seq1.p1 gnl/MRDRNA2_/MRDRNA2_16118_c0~~gnl/MRDRNA2_/MRDRNA2_16118_c0_seq1.p1  ORF type:complete len:415 (+),score=63.14 gnl/MRDRNA2_/MRDRNA2_16118_c0_seq1:3-1247(+)